MKVTFFSNFLNHHQLPFCLAMDRLTEGNFTFVATTPVPAERLNMGYHDMNKQYPFVQTTYDSSENAIAAQVLALKSDVVIIGSAPEIYVKERIRQKKLTFRYSERIYKQGLWKVFSPRRLKVMMLDHTRYWNHPVYMLCASAYTPFDYSLTASYLNKTYKWGYFPEVKQQDVDALLAHKREKQRISILWVARLIGLKHPEVAIFLAERLKKNGYDFDLNIIGNGEMEAQLRMMICDKQLEGCVHMLGAMPPEAVRENMEQADIFLFTSDFNEGWGAVLNESMNSACAVVASHAIGSVPFLLENGKNGYIYRYGDMDSLYEHVVRLIDQPEQRESIGRNAYHTLATQWNADIAAERLMTLSRAICSGKSTEIFAEGPCSYAPIIGNNWMR